MFSASSTGAALASPLLPGFIKAQPIMREREVLPSTSADPVKDMEHAKAALHRLRTEIDHNERLATLGLLAAGVAHEINNILTPVLAYAQLAASHPTDADLHRKAIEKTILGVETATRIADSILGFAGHDDSAEADVATALERAFNCLARHPNKDQIIVQLDVQPGTAVRMNALNLQQVLINLILNAQAAMKAAAGTGNLAETGDNDCVGDYDCGGDNDSGGAIASERQTDHPAAAMSAPTRRLTIAALTRADGTVGIRVMDTGSGIAKDIIARIFEPFVTTSRQSGKRQSGASSGSGLGLSICRRLITQAGGTITASSIPGRGTTFLIVLPSPKINRAKAG